MYPPQENGSLKEALSASSLAAEEARQGLVVQELLGLQLTAQVEQLQGEKEGSSFNLEELKKERNSFREE